MTAFGRIMYAHGIVGSTQDIAREKALAGEPAGAVVTAEYQTGGRGRQGRGWFAPRGANVCMTVIGPPVALAQAWQVALVAGVAVAEGVREAAADAPARLRFPNDVLLYGSKLAGVLVETVPHPKAGYVTPLVGIGVNVNVRAEEFPEALRDKATSLLRETGQWVSVGSVTSLIVRRLSAHWEVFQNGPLDEAILARWRELADPDARRVFVLDGASVLCRVVDIAADGAVSLEAGDGREFTVPAAQVILGVE